MRWDSEGCNGKQRWMPELGWKSGRNDELRLSDIYCCLTADGHGGSLGYYHWRGYSAVVARSLCMRKALGSNPSISNQFFAFLTLDS